MKMMPVTSSQVSHVGYDATTKTMAVHFHNGGRYHYANVEDSHFGALVSAKSIGKHLHQHFKSSKHHPATRQK